MITYWQLFSLCNYTYEYSYKLSQKSKLNISNVKWEQNKTLFLLRLGTWMATSSLRANCSENFNGPEASGLRTPQLINYFQWNYIYSPSSIAFFLNIYKYKVPTFLNILKKLYRPNNQTNWTFMTFSDLINYTVANFKFQI